MAPPSFHEALVRHGSALRLTHVPTIPPPAGGLRIAPSFVGVCGTDLQILNGSRPDTAEVLGHEGFGTIVETAGTGALAVGEQVVFNPAAQLSRGWILGHNTPGLFQQFITVDSQAVEDGVVMPASECKPPVLGALSEPLAAIVYAHELISNIVPDLRTVAIFGGGPIGLLAAIYLGGLGAKVLLVHPTQARLDTVARLEILNPGAMVLAGDDATDRILERSGGHSVDAALICATRTGAPSALRHAIQVVRHGGCVDLVTNYPESADVSPGITATALRATRSTNVCGSPHEGKYLLVDVSGRRIAFTGHRGTTHNHLKKALRALRDDAASYMKLITHVLPLRAAAEAIQSLSKLKRHSADSLDCIKLVVDMSSHV